MNLCQITIHFGMFSVNDSVIFDHISTFATVNMIINTGIPRFQVHATKFCQYLFLENAKPVVDIKKNQTEETLIYILII